MVSKVPIGQRLLADEVAERIYRRVPELRRAPQEWCPTCDKKGKFFWQGEWHDCDCYMQVQLMKHYLNSGIGRMYQNLSWDDFQGDPGLKSICDRYVENHEKLVKAGIGIFLTGKFGVGKTMSMNLLMKDLVKLGYTVYATTFSGMIEMWTAGWADKEDKDLFQKKIRMSEILLIDDIGKEMRTKNNLSESTFDYVLRSRVQENKPTFITTNMDQGDLEDGYGSAILSLINEMSIKSEVKGKDFRVSAGDRKIEEVMNGVTRPIF